MKLERQLTSVAHQIIIDNMPKANNLVAVDATVGNGNDTLFLANIVGDTGSVYGFDIQQVAIETTKSRLKKESLNKRVSLICDSHENIDRYITKNIDIAMFNLGYLPQGNKEVITNVESTICAITKVKDRLNIHGIITILCYPGHNGGEEESLAVSSLLKEYSFKKYIVSKIDIVNTKGTPPVLYIIAKTI